MAVAAAVALAILARVVGGGLFRPCLRLGAAACLVFVVGAARSRFAARLSGGIAFVSHGGGGANGAVVVEDEPTHVGHCVPRCVGLPQIVVGGWSGGGHEVTYCVGRGQLLEDDSDGIRIVRIIVSVREADFAPGGLNFAPPPGMGGWGWQDSVWRRKEGPGTRLS